MEALFSIEEVKEMLPFGNSFSRTENGCTQYLYYIDNTYFKHSVIGKNDYGSYGGVSELLISDLPGRFEKNGWKMI